MEEIFTEHDYPFKIKPNFSTLDSITEFEHGRGRKIYFVQGDSLRQLSGFKPKVIHV